MFYFLRVEQKSSPTAVRSAHCFTAVNL